MRCYPHFNLPMRSSRGFASTATTNLTPCSDSLSLRLRPKGLNLAGDGKSPDHYAKGTPSRISRKGIGLRPLVGMWFQVHYPPLVGFFPSFARATEFAIGRQRVFSLAGWSPQIQTRFHVSGPTQVPLGSCFAVAYGTVTLYGRPFQIVPLADHFVTPMCGPTTPRGKTLAV